MLKWLILSAITSFFVASSGNFVELEEISVTDDNNQTNCCHSLDFVDVVNERSIYKFTSLVSLISILSAQIAIAGAGSQAKDYTTVAFPDIHEHLVDHPWNTAISASLLVNMLSEISKAPLGVEDGKYSYICRILSGLLFFASWFVWIDREAWIPLSPFLMLLLCINLYRSLLFYGISIIYTE